MLDRFYMNMASSQSAGLLRYCKMENIPLEELLCVEKPKKSMEHRLKSAAVHLLQSADKKLNTMIDRLSAEVESNGIAQGQIL
jgi:hypothetical protein